jgi:hypothetical protein
MEVTQLLPNSTPPDYVSIKGGTVVRNGQILASGGGSDPAELYRSLGYNYPKFFKMDSLCKWAWLGAETLLKRQDSDGWLYEGLDKQKIAVVMSTRDGCLEVDHRYQETLQSIPSPALFVYTLPNIMLGEICIRHGFTGEQICEVQEAFDAERLLFWVKDLIANRDVSHCLFGWADSVGGHHEVTLFWVDADTLQKLDADQLQTVHNKPV